MEEDIKILEEFIEDYNACYPEEKEWVAIYPNQIKAIENLINRNKELEEENEKLLKRNKWYKEYRECFSIPKSKVEEKIEELVKEADYRTEDNPKGRVHFQKEPCDYQIQVLQELLED